MTKKNINKSILTALVTLIVLALLGLITTWVLFKLFPSEIELQIKKAGMTATIIGGSGLFIIATWFYSNMFFKIMKVVAPCLIVVAMASYFVPQSTRTTPNSSPEVKSSKSPMATSSKKNSKMKSPLVLNKTELDNYIDSKPKYEQLTLLIMMLNDERNKNIAYKKLVEVSGKDYGYNIQKWNTWLDTQESSNKPINPTENTSVQN